ncbi:hypothetical protein PT974_12317 [Cladobotryum mycophilum]|uniref:Uncharacterized protein n=1 Tax=Cladobotryum mycophilum TaxID=491253 RepID=A0ABR0S7N2_9HYPO
MPNKYVDYGELRVTLTSDYYFMWSDKNSGASKNMYLRPVGDVCIGHHDEINGKQATLLIEPSPTASKSNPPVKEPIDYKHIWESTGSSSDASCSIYRPVAPEGYVALGDIAAAASQVNPPSLGVLGSQKIPISTGSFIAHGAYSQPSTGLAKSLTLDLENQFQAFSTAPPAFTADSFPNYGEKFNRLEQCRVTLPFISFYEPTDPQCVGNIADPFCTLSRYISWIVEGVWVNNSSGTYERQVEIKFVVSSDQAQEISKAARVSVSAGSGITLVDSDISLNHQFTSPTGSRTAEYQEKTTQDKFEMKPFWGDVLFLKQVEVSATRLDGSDSIAQLEFAAYNDWSREGVALTKGFSYSGKLGDGVEIINE